MEGRYAFGIDVGGTTIKMGLFTAAGRLEDKWEIATDKSQNGEGILRDISREINKEIIKYGILREEISGIGIGVPGPVTDNGRVMGCVNLGWGEKNVEKELGSLTGIYVCCGNDANVAALGEIWQGGGMGYKNMVMITLGTGVGGGIILNHKIVNGSDGAAGEIGHLPINPHETEYCTCGNKGCLEQYCSAGGVVKTAEKILNSSDKYSTMRESNVLTAKTVFDSAKANDELALEAVEQFGKTMGRALAAVAAVINPQLFLFGGGVSKAGAIIMETVKKYYKNYAFNSAKNAAFKLATLGNDAGIYGGAMLIINKR